MASIERPYDRGTRRAARAMAELGEGFRDARLRLGASQREVSLAARVDRADYSRIEAGKLVNLRLTVAFRVGAVLGLDVSVRAFPGGRSIRDAGQGRRLQVLIESVGPPLVAHTEVALPRTTDHLELRSWDLVVAGEGRRTAIELEVRLYDVQAQQRRWNLKRRDDPVDGFILAVADTKANRRVLLEYGELLGLARLRTATVLATLRAGRHPPSGIVIL